MLSSPSELPAAVDIALQFFPALSAICYFPLHQDLSSNVLPYTEMPYIYELQRLDQLCIKGKTTIFILNAQSLREKLPLSETDEKVYYFLFHFTAKYIFMTWVRYSDFLSCKSLDNGDMTFTGRRDSSQLGHCTSQRQDFFLFFFYFLKQKSCVEVD